MPETAVHEWLDTLANRKASDLYLSYGTPPRLRTEKAILPLGEKPLDDADLEAILEVLCTPEQRDEFQATLELNTALHWNNHARFRVNVFRQQSHTGFVIRRIQMEIPTLEQLLLPPAYADLAIAKRGLILVAGPTGSGKSTSLAAMVGHRNRHGEGHVITVEDPIEFVHQHDQCIITQRDVGLDTYSYAVALKNALRQRPDMVVIGEIRDREVMEQAMYFSETSHLCIATIHANNSSQALDRILGFFPKDRHTQVQQNLAINLKAVLSQRLIPTMQGGRTLALEVLLNRGLIRQLIEEGKNTHIHEMIEKGAGEGMQTFDQHLYKLFTDQVISEETALAEADSKTNLLLQINNAKRSTAGSPGSKLYTKAGLYDSQGNF